MLRGAAAAALLLAACAGKPPDTAAPLDTAPVIDTVDTDPHTDTDTDTDCIPLDRFEDADGDGFGAAAVLACDGAPGTADVGGDCDDADPTAYPGAEELCDGMDQDCDGSLADEPTIAWLDGDGDGYGDLPAACPPEAGAVGLDGDCDDADPAVNPGAPDICNGSDDDCDGLWDEGPDAPASVMDGTSSDCDAVGETADLDDAAEARLLGRLDPWAEQMGTALNIADVNADGWPDVLVGARQTDYPFGETTTDTGMVYVFFGPFGPGDRSAEDADLLIYGGTNSHVDEATPAGDVTGDGVQDFIVGGTDGNTSDGTIGYMGNAYLLPGPILGNVDLGTGFVHYVDPPWGYRMEGASVQPGDLDGDGLADVLLGCIDRNPWNGGAAVYLLPGPANMAVADAPTIFLADVDELAGVTGTGLGDVNGDGRPDFAIQRHGNYPAYGDFFVLVTEPHSGVVDWRDAGPLYGWFDAPDDPWLEPGWSIRNVGDVTGDGHDDVALPSANYGYVHIMAGPLPDDRDFDVFEESVAVLQDPWAWEPGVWNVESRGDINGDGVADLTLASPRFTRPELRVDFEWEDGCNHGALYNVNGPFEGYVDLSIEADQVVGTQHWGELGTELAAGMDLNGDGATDIVATSPNIPFSSDGLADGGAAYIFFGTP